MVLREYKREWEEMGGGSLVHGFGYAGAKTSSKHTRFHFIICIFISIKHVFFLLNIHGNYVQWSDF